MQPYRENSSSRFWEHLVSEYTTKNLSFSNDILVAIAGVARRLSPVFGTYLAGHWQYSLPLGLMWTSSSCHPRPTEYTAPTFCWASQIGPVRFETHLEHESLECTVVKVDCTPGDADIFGSVTGGYIKLKGQLTECASGEASRLPNAPAKGELEKGEETAKFIPDTMDDHHHPSGVPLYCFQICSYPDVEFYHDEYGTRFPPWDPTSQDVRTASCYSKALILRRAGGLPPKFQRLGFARRINKRWFEGQVESEITII